MTTTRAERKAAKREKMASQRAAKEAALLQQQEAEGKRGFRKNMIILASLIVTMPLLAVGIVAAGNNIGDRKETINRLVETNYEVQDASSIRTTSFTGDDVAVIANGKIINCRGLGKEDLEAKKPLSCEGGIVVQPKK